MSVIVISIDALIESDLNYLKDLPALGKIISLSNKSVKIKAIYPTLTYPCHAAIISGFYPDKTAVISNEDKTSGSWLWFRDSIKCKILTDYLKENNKTTAAICWPVLGASDIDYLVPEIWADTQYDDPDERFHLTSSKKGYEYYKKNKELLNWMKTPEMDNFASIVAAQIIKDHHPDITFVHLSYLDHQRHKNGFESEKNIDALKFIDKKIELILSSANDNDTFIILGDHGHRPFNSFFSLPRAINDNRYVFNSASFISYVTTFNIDKQDALKKLNSLKLLYPNVVDKIITKERAKSKYHLDGSFDFIIEARDGYNFKDDLNSLFEPSSPYCSAHGFLPEKGPFSPLIITNHDIKADECNIVDIAPTILSLFGIHIDCDGKSLLY